jgi:GMP synthase-like glutamine amidotransferase
MPALHALVHAHLEGPARIADLATEAGYEVIVRNLHQGDQVPADIPAGDLLVVMGGPMGVGDIDDARYPWLAQEVALIRRCLAGAIPVIGVCLGAQLLAHAAGAKVYPLTVGEPPVRHREVGWGAIHFTRSATDEPVLTGLDPAEPVLHWHGDTFDLPSGATLLGSTLACPNQFFRIGRRAWGLQFHIEIITEAVAGWVAADADFVIAAGGRDLGQRILSDTALLMPRHRVQGDRLIRNILATCR